MRDRDGEGRGWREGGGEERRRGGEKGDGEGLRKEGRG